MSARTWADELFLYAKDEPAFASLASSFIAEDPARHVAEVVYGAADFPIALNKYMNLKQINIYTHGNVGYLYLAGRVGREGLRTR